MCKEKTVAQPEAVWQAMAGVAAAIQSGEPDTAPPNGQPGDFDFLSGNWKIAHRRLVDEQWDAFEGEASVHAMLGGIASVEELRIPERNFSGMGVRLLDLDRRLWADHWIGSQTGVMDKAPGWGGFTDGVGCWDTQQDGVITRGVWDRITPHSCRWRQLRSADQGRSWRETWIMHWRRA